MMFYLRLIRHSLLVFGALLCVMQTRAAAIEKTEVSREGAPIPSGWILINSKGHTFEMGQEFAGHRWTYTFPVHPVAFSYDFLMASTQVTQAEYKNITGQNPTLHPGDENRPIDNVSWFDAVLYCNALSKRDGLPIVYNYTAEQRDSAGNIIDLTGLNINIKSGGYRLLTSAEYEYVVRGGTTTRWFFGDDENEQDKATEYAWCDRNAEKTTHPVGQLKPNAFRVFDMTGNLWMWCNDWYNGPYPTAAQADPSGPATGEERVARGGAFKNDVYHERSAYHWQWTSQTRNFEVGFRIARTVQSAVAEPVHLADINEATWYRIVASHSGKPLEIEGGQSAKDTGRVLQQNQYTGQDNQLFQFRQVQSGYYQIFAKHSGKVLQIRDNSLKDHAIVEQGEPTGAENQLFTVVKDTDESYNIVVKSSGYCLDVTGGINAVGNDIRVIVYPASNALNHKFKLMEFSLPTGKPVVSRLAKVPNYTPPFDAAKAGLTPLFDGKTLEGWIGDPAGWAVVDGAIVGSKDNQNIMSAADYDDFRLIISTIQVESPTNHQGVGFWGDRLPNGTYGYGACIDLMPPMNWTWDYSTNHGLRGIYTINRDLDKDLGLTRSEWTQAEILVNRSKGTIRMAVNGLEVLSFQDRNPARFKKGPIGLQAHAGNHEVRYKDIYIDVSPKENRLITLKN